MKRTVKVVIDEKAKKIFFECSKNCILADYMAVAGALVVKVSEETEKPIEEVLKDFNDMVLETVEEDV